MSTYGTVSYLNVDSKKKAFEKKVWQRRRSLLEKAKRIMKQGLHR